MKAPAPTTSGSQPPLTILVRLAAKNVSSMVRNTAAPAIVIQSGFRHTTRKSTKASSVLVANVPVTAMPYADARALELRNPSTRPITATSRNQLTAGT